ncbi:hypothetical protein AVEN_41848-1 [Araneus ventricosus]|uniref:Uncharacterized protein n=1 Tax=Araneus ventricosus TaxID=182803 RepID=A0A4Y2ACQ0_ARAVE|nr:hypothetical protein AVEN_41848-1 [Araneus ventricosus]
MMRARVKRTDEQDPRAADYYQVIRRSHLVRRDRSEGLKSHLDGAPQGPYRCRRERYIAGAVPTKVPYHPFNYQMVAAIFIRVVSRHGKVTMRYWMKPLTAPPGGKRWS